MSKVAGRQALLKAILDERNKQAHIGALAEAFLDRFGGVDGVMGELRLIYDNSTAPIKAKIILSGVDLVREANPKSKGADPVQALSWNELEKAAQSLLASDVTADEQ